MSYLGIRFPIVLAVMSASLALAPSASALDPVVTASAPTGITTDNTPQLGYTVEDDDPDTVICAIDPVVPIVVPVFEGFAPCPPSPYTSPTLSDGDHSYFVVAKDMTGNYGYGLKYFTIDSTGPVITITGVVEGAVFTTAWPPLEITYSDAVVGGQSLTCSYDGAEPMGCADPAWLNAPLTDGSHTLKIVATDVAGNTTTRVITFTINARGGLAAPRTAKFVVKRGKLKRAKYATTVKVSFAMSLGSSATSCTGRAKTNVKVKRKSIASASVKFRQSGAKCVATAVPKIAKKFKGKKLSITFTYISGPIKPFSLQGSGKL